MLFESKIIENRELRGDYRKVVFDTPLKAAEVAPGQFVHVEIPNLRERVLRRPFSICDVSESGALTLVYKIVGVGTEALSALPAGGSCGILGPLGTPFSVPGPGETPIVVAGGYGSAATYILAKRSLEPGVLLLGARSAEDLILVDEFEKLGFEVRLATDDGSAGIKGFVTELLRPFLESGGTGKHRFYGCGPQGMLMAMGRELVAAGIDGEISLDELMCCGVGACFACVAKVKDASSGDGWRYARTCVEGPVFKASEVVLD
jgi:dihydroorotate dehydrogenase electron transfer subunit